jgi:clumping factor A
MDFKLSNLIILFVILITTNALPTFPERRERFDREKKYNLDAQAVSHHETSQLRSKDINFYHDQKYPRDNYEDRNTDPTDSNSPPRGNNYSTDSSQGDEDNVDATSQEDYPDTDTDNASQKNNYNTNSSDSFQGDEDNIDPNNPSDGDNDEIDATSQGDYPDTDTDNPSQENNSNIDSNNPAQGDNDNTDPNVPSLEDKPNTDPNLPSQEYNDPTNDNTDNGQPNDSINPPSPDDTNDHTVGDTAAAVVGGVQDDAYDRGFGDGLTDASGIEGNSFHGNDYLGDMEIWSSYNEGYETGLNVGKTGTTDQNQEDAFPVDDDGFPEYNPADFGDQPHDDIPGDFPEYNPDDFDINPSGDDNPNNSQSNDPDEGGSIGGNNDDPGTWEYPEITPEEEEIANNYFRKYGSDYQYGQWDPNRGQKRPLENDDENDAENREEKRPKLSDDDNDENIDDIPQQSQSQPETQQASVPEAQQSQPPPNTQQPPPPNTQQAASDTQQSQPPPNTQQPPPPETQQAASDTQQSPAQPQAQDSSTDPPKPHFDKTGSTGEGGSIDEAGAFEKGAESGDEAATVIGMVASIG